MTRVAILLGLAILAILAYRWRPTELEPLRLPPDDGPATVNLPVLAIVDSPSGPWAILAQREWAA